MKPPFLYDEYKPLQLREFLEIFQIILQVCFLLSTGNLNTGKLATGAYRFWLETLCEKIKMAIENLSPKLYR